MLPALWLTLSLLLSSTTANWRVYELKVTITNIGAYTLQASIYGSANLWTEVVDVGPFPSLTTYQFDLNLTDVGTPQKLILQLDSFISGLKFSFVSVDVDYSYSNGLMEMMDANTDIVIASQECGCDRHEMYESIHDI